MNDSFSQAKGMAQMLIQSETSGSTLTRDKIAEIVDRVINISPSFQGQIDPDRLIADLESQFNVWIGRETTLSDNTDHVAWLTADRKTGWRHWNRYRLLLERHLPEAAITGLDQMTDRTLGRLEDPERSGPWDRRGLVVGHVQSGKTANYTGLICKAADAGYSVIIVLAGMHNNLRSQTQMRLDEGFLGYTSQAIQRDEKPRAIGVGELDPDIRPDTVTNSSEQGDFSRRVANNFQIHPGRRPLLFVVKKNASVLKNLLDWVRSVAQGHDSETGRPVVASVPLLVIDDEADHASVDTKQQDFDENDRPDPEHDPTRINSLIRKVLFTFEQSAYVGYTATPFANIFIHDRGRTQDEGDDLFPRSFITNLPAPSNYTGPVRVFGLEEDENGEPRRPLRLVRHISDHATGEREGWMPPKHRNGHRPLYGGEPVVPPTLSRAIQSFILSIAARRARGQTNSHNSMLIHVTRFTSVQREVRNQVDAELQRIARRLQLGEGQGARTVAQSLKELWESDFIPTTRNVQEEMHDPAIQMPDWSEVEPLLLTAAKDIQLFEINGSAGDVLEYETHRDTGLNVIAVGGDKLARGLTLEGLTVSYFLRTSKMYDTLMQMGRWFGYRPGYLDLCRLYTTSDLHEWFEHITEAGEELRQEFDHMAAVGGTPKDYGLRVRSHPALTVTSRVKMRHGTEMQLSYAGSVSETTVFHRSETELRKNLGATEQFLGALGEPSETNVRRSRPEGRSHTWSEALLWTDVTASDVTSFLSAFTTHTDAPRANTGLIRQFIEGQNQIDELTRWTVVLRCADAPGEVKEAEIGGYRVPLIKRSPRNPDDEQNDRYVIRRLLSPRDESIDLDADAYAAALSETIEEWQSDPGRYRNREQPTRPFGPSLRRQRPPQYGLLLLYPLPSLHPNGDGVPVIGMGISFPASKNARSVRYNVNTVYRDLEL